MLQAGDTVFVEDSAKIDVGFMAWSFVEANHLAIVKQRMEMLNPDKKEIPESEVIYALEWPVEFSGGHNCQGNCAERRGQFVSGKHLSLCFEASREVNTVPNINGFTDGEGCDRYITK